MPKNTKLTWEQPHDRMTRITDAMINTMNDHPERTNPIFAVIMLMDSEGPEAAVAMHGYENMKAAWPDVLEHLQAMAAATGVNLVVMPMRESYGGSMS